LLLLDTQLSNYQDVKIAMQGQICVALANGTDSGMTQETSLSKRN